MLQLDNFTLNLLKKSIGKKITYFAGTRMSWSDREVSFHDRVLQVFFLGGYSLEFKSEFFETEYGEVFYDYILLEEISYIGNSSTYTLNSDPIYKIEIYGRPFSIEEFEKYPDIYYRHSTIKQTDDLFILYFANGKRLMIVMHDYFPNINLYVGEESIQDFLENSLSGYSLHHVIK